MKKQKAVRWLMQRMRKRIPGIIGITVTSIASTLLSVVFALSTKDVINSATSGTRQEFMQAVLSLAGIIVGILLCATLQRYLLYRLSAELDRDWKQGMVHRILRSEYVRISEFHSGELINRLNNDVHTVDDGVLTILPGAASLATRLIAVVAVLVAMAPIFTIALLAAGVVVTLFTALVRRRLRDMHKAVSASQGKLSGFLQEIFEKVLLVQAMNVEREVERRGQALMEERYSLQKKQWMISLTANTCVGVLGYTSAFAALVWCANGIAHGVMSFGELTAVTQLVGQLQGPFVNLSSIFPKYVAMSAAAERLMELEEACQTERSDIAETKVDYRAVTAINCENLTFSYDREQIFSQCSFSLPKGAFAAIIGPSGIGKSTLLKLLLGIFQPTDGQLFFSCKNGAVPIDNRTRKLFAYVPQGNLLFSGTLRENLLLTCPDATQDEIEKAIYVSYMDEYLPQLPNGLDTMLGENAHGLSEGQAQRLSIARAVLSRAPILLLDEATSALDAEGEAIVLQRIRQLEGKTCIAVTHRPSAMKLADWLMKVDNQTITCEKIAQ